MTKEEQYQKYLDLILKWSKSADLTASSDPNEIKNKHFDDSAAVVPFLEGVKTLIDIGSGAGFPGIPIKIECPEIMVTLLDSRRKKINFLRQVIFELNLSGIEAIQGRAEDPEFFRSHGPFDAVISRATWPLNLFLEIADPYYTNEGRLIAMKGPKIKEELRQARPMIDKYGLVLENTHSYRLSRGEERHLLVFRRK
jgi:16S rRNA (guanine527-N7)-methyltransferase